MRRLTLELSGTAFEKIKAASPFRNVKALQILHLLRFSDKEIASICRLEIPASLSAGKNGIFSSFRAQILEKEKDGALIVYVSAKPRHDVFPWSLIRKGGYVVSPFEFRDGKATITFLGNNRQVIRFLRGLQKQKITHKVLALTDASFSPDSPLRRLTQKQLFAIRSAFELGYFDIPRRVSSEDLGEKLRLDPSTLNIHLRKAEKKILSELFSNH